MTAIILTLGCVFITFILVAEWRNKSSKIKLQHQHSLLVLNKLYNLIASLQKHRGISAAYLRGECNALPPLDNLRRQVTEQINFLNNQPTVKNLDRWLAFNDHWFRLRQNSQILSVNNSYEQHTNMIANLLLFFEDIAEMEKFNHKKFPRLPGLSILWRKLPKLIEHMGQVRAIGVGVIIDETCSRVDRLKLSALIEEINQLSKIVLLQLEENSNQTSRLQNLLQRAQENTAQLTHMVRHQLIAAKQINLDIKNFYIQASQAMDINACLLNYEMEQLAEILAMQQISELNKDTALNKKIN